MLPKINRWIEQWKSLGFEDIDIVQRGEQLTEDQIRDIQIIVLSPQFHSLKRYFLSQAMEFYHKCGVHKDPKLADFGNYIVAIVDDLESVKAKKIEEPKVEDPYNP